MIANPAHARAMAAIHAAAFPDDPWDYTSFMSLLGQPGAIGFIDPRGGVLMLRVAADEAEILTIGVTARRRGLGTALMRAAIEKAKTMGAKMLHLEAAAGNEATQAFYKSLGFAPSGRRKSYYANGDDAVLFSLRLDPE